MNKKFSKFMLTSASALALLAAYPSVASTAEVVGFDLPAITAEAATQGNAFIRVVRALPSVANITSADAASVRAARNLYNSLPNAEKANADVARWAEFLTIKEDALPVDHVRNFLLEAKVLPNVAEISAMNATEFAQAKVDLQAARASYAQLTDAEKANADVARWAGFLTVKEDAFGVTFILEAKALPSVRQINEMNEDQLAVLAEDIASVRELYEALSPTAKADADVARWNGFVDAKEEAAEGEDVVEDEELVVESVSAIEAITVTVGDEVVLPETVEVTLNDAVEATEEEEAVEATVVVVAVEWEEFVAEEAGEFDVNGTIVLDEDAEFTISEELAAVTVTVVVEEAALEVVEVSAINATTVEVEFAEALAEDFDLTDKTVNVGEMVATYVADSYNAEAKTARFALAGEDKLVDAVEYTVTSDWAADATFVARVAAEYVASYEKVTTDVVESTVDELDNVSETEIYLTALNQYGEEIDAEKAAKDEVSVSLNNMPLIEGEDSTAEYYTSYDNGDLVINITEKLAEADELVIGVTNTKVEAGQDDVVLADNEFTYEVIKGDAAVLTTFKVTANKLSVPAYVTTPDADKNNVTLKVDARDQYNNPVDTTGKVRWVVNGKTETDENDGTFTFNSDKPGTYTIQAFSTVNSKLQGSVTVTVGAAELTSLTLQPKLDLADPEEKSIVSPTRYNNEEITLGYLLPSSGAALLAENVQFEVVANTTGNEATDVTVTATSDKDGNVIVKAKTAKPGIYTITPFVGESFTDADVVKLSPAITLNTTVNPKVADISDITFDAKELKVGATVKKEIVVTNKHGEVLTNVLLGEASAISLTSSNPSVTAEITRETDENDVTKTYLELTANAEGTSVVTLQAGEVVAPYTLSFTDAEITEVNAGSDVTGLVANEDLNHYQAVQFLDQDKQAIAASDSEVLVKIETKNEAGEVTDVTATYPSAIAKISKLNKDDDGKVESTIAADNDGNAVNYIGINAKDLPKGTYTFTVSYTKEDAVKSDTFNVTVGAERAIKTIAVTPATETVALNGTTTFTVELTDQYGKAFDYENSSDVLSITTLDSAIGFGELTQAEDKDNLPIDGKYTFTATGLKNGSHVITVSNGEGTDAVKATANLTVAPGAELAQDIEIIGDDVKDGVATKQFKYVAPVTEGSGEEAVTTYETITDLNVQGLDAADKAVALDQNDILWTTEDSDFIDVDSDGNVIIVGEFDADQDTRTVTVTADFNGIKTDIELTISEAASKLVPGTLEISDAELVDADDKKDGVQVKLDKDKAFETLSFAGEDQYGDPIYPNVFSTSFNAGVATVDAIGSEVTVESVAVGTTTVRVTAGSDVIFVDVEVTELPNEEQVAPTGLETAAVTEAGNDGKITGLSSDAVYEYKLKSAEDWIAVDANATEITSLEAGTYEVRFAAKDGFNAGTSAEVTVAPITINSITPVEPVVGAIIDITEEDAKALLPKTTTIVDSADVSHTVNLTWAFDAVFDATASAVNNATATFTLPDGVEQADPAVTLEVTTTLTIAAE